MTNLEKYNEMLKKPQIKAEGFSLNVASSNHFKSVEISLNLGRGLGENEILTNMDLKVFLKPEEVDYLIENLNIAKNALLESKN